MMKEVAPTRHHSSRRQLPHSTHPVRRSPSLHTLTNTNTHTSQRRHSSNTSDPTPSYPHSPQNLGGLTRKKFLWYANAPTDQFQVDAAWDAYDALGETRNSLKSEDILLFAKKVMSATNHLYSDLDTRDSIHIWGHRIQRLLDDVEPRIPPLSISDHQRRCLQVQAAAAVGDTKRAKSLARDMQASMMEYTDMSDVLIVYESLIKSIWRHHDAIHVLDYLVLEWQSLGGHLIRRSAETHIGEVKRYSHRLRQTAHEILEHVTDPAVVLASKLDWSEDRRLNAGILLIEALCIKRLPEDGLAVMKEMDRQYLPVPASLKLTLVRALVRAVSFELANSLFRSLPPKRNKYKYYASTGLYLFAHQGDVTRALEHWVQLDDNGWISLADMTMLLQVYAVQGDVKEVVRLFDKYFPKPTDDIVSQYTPTISHYTIVIFAYAQRSEFEGMNVWLEKMAAAGITPDEYVYTAIVKSFAMRGEVEALSAVLDQMRSAGMQPSVIHYTIAISLLANRKDPVSAEALYNRALQEGVVPDRRMVTSLMNAHVEASSWQGVIRAFDYLKASPARRMGLSIEVYNTLLKAYVLIGAPFAVVSDVFSRFEDADIRPDSRTFTLLIQSACDAGRMDIASEIFQEMDKHAAHWESHLHVNVYVLTIMMAGFLRRGDKIRAKSVYDEMRARNIQPTSVTFAAILTAYGKSKTEGSLQVAEEFLKSLVDAEEKPWIKPVQGRQTALEDLYGPLMDVYARRANSEEVERLFQSMLDAGGKPTLGGLTALLHGYCRSGRITAVLEVWSQIFELGLRYSRTSSLFDSQDTPLNGGSEMQKRRQANMLCVPLSIYMDALSAAGMHDMIAAVWNQMKTHGFTFDSHNWNHLAVVLVRAGEPARAFEVVEKVILPYQRRSQDILTKRDQEPETPLTFEDVSEEEADEEADEETPFQGPSHSRRRRAVTQKVAKFKAKLSDLAPDEEHPDDFAHPLHVLHQISPAWSIWRPHSVTLGLLGKVLRSLESGIPIQPVMKADQMGQQPDREDETQRRARINLAADILNQVHTDSPNAVRAVEEYQRRRNNRTFPNLHNTIQMTSI